MRKKVLVLGSTGLAGHKIYQYLKSLDKYDIYNISYRTKLNDNTLIVDVKNESLLKKSIEDISPNVIINSIGVLVNESNNNIKNAIYINSYLPHLLVDICNSMNIKLIHISTDCVFLGDKKEPYIESDIKDGQDIYAKTKILGEVIDDTHLTIRTSIIGPCIKKDGQGLFHWFMNQNEVINGYKKAIWSGVTTLQLAKGIDFFISNDIKGLYHLTNNSSISKYELLKLFKKYINKDIIIKSVDGKESNKSFVDTIDLLDDNLPNYENMIKDMVKDILKNEDIYRHYL